MKLSVIVITLNEEKNIEACLESLSWADEVIVVDGGSNDSTCSLAKKLGVDVVYRDFDNFSAQRNFAMSKTSNDWVFFVDADERPSKELIKEIKNLFSADTLKPCVYGIPRRTYFLGKRLRFSDTRNDAPDRLFPRSEVEWMQSVHEKIIANLPHKVLTNYLHHYSTRDFSHYKEKLKCYIPYELEIMKEKNRGKYWWNCFFFPPAKFIYLYFLKLGILDGTQGFLYAMLSAYYVYLKNKLYYLGK